jgi:hypothetical protein
MVGELCGKAVFMVFGSGEPRSLRVQPVSRVSSPVCGVLSLAMCDASATQCVLSRLRGRWRQHASFSQEPCVLSRLRGRWRQHVSSAQDLGCPLPSAGFCRGFCSTLRPLNVSSPSGSWGRGGGWRHASSSQDLGCPLPSVGFCRVLCDSSSTQCVLSQR